MISHLNNLTSAPLLALEDGSFTFPPQASTFAGGVDFLFYAITAISLVFFIIIVAVMGLFVMKYRRRPGVDPIPSPHHNTALEVAWSVLPAGILVYIFGAGFIGWLDMKSAPAGAYEINVEAKSWSWSFTYPKAEGLQVDELHVPVDESIKLNMMSTDVIHSLFVPAFRIKQDLVPGRYSSTWFNATRPGTYRLYCTEYCGQKHSLMTANVVVHESGEFENWAQAEIERLLDLPLPELGELMYKRQGCIQCHSVDGSTAGKAGPTFKGSFGTQQKLVSGETITVDENYIRESILEPMAKVRAGYKPVMPSYQGRLKERYILALIEYIKSLKEE